MRIKIKITTLKNSCTAVFLLDLIYSKMETCNEILSITIGIRVSPSQQVLEDHRTV